MTLEVIETALIGDERRTAETIKRLMERGIGVALDDFGTRHSSLAYLRRFPFSRIKIDRSCPLSGRTRRSAPEARSGRCRPVAFEPKNGL